MKKVLIYSVCEDSVALELAIENVEAGNEVCLIECDYSLGNCQHNVKGNRLMCCYCCHSMCSLIKRLGLHEKTTFLRLSHVINQADEKEASELAINFNSVKELKDLTYKGAQLGYGAFSSYVTFSRNVMPDINEDFKKYIRYLFKKEVVVYNAIERLHAQHHFDHIIFHNGRFAQFKPFLEFARLNHVDYIATEVKNYKGKILMNNFHNDIPHSIEYLANNVLVNWEKGDENTREEIGRSFYERRKQGIAAGDKVYVKEQHVGELPKDWDSSAENISIFNSSEDEFCSVSKDYDKKLLFPNQYEALKTIFEHYKDDQTKHFYLRIHPNLKDVPYKSHLSLYELKYKNVTIIPADSSVSSYTLLDHSNKIIIFNSTMGVEASYWGKPVISLTKYIYWKLGLLYHPQNESELWNLIDDKHLMVFKDLNLIKYGYWLLHPNNPEIEKVPYTFMTDGFLGHKIMSPSIIRFLGSYKLGYYLKRVINRLSVFDRVKSIPCTEPYNA